MSKIQEALRKIQSSRNSPPSTAVPDPQDSLVVAKLIDSDGVTGDQVSDRKRLHVDRAALRDAGLIAPEYHAQLLENQYREIKRPLIANAFGKRTARVADGSLIMVTSAIAGEGKTFTSINLALSMAQERDHSVILVDADVAKPHTSAMFGATDEMGLLDALENPEIPVKSLILPTDVRNLSLLPAGKPRHHATELLSSSAMETVAKILAQLSEGQIVILDSPPLLQTSEAKVISDVAGQVVMVVRAEKTSQDAVTGALATLDERKAINMVLNQARVSGNESAYGYGYAYGNHKKEEAPTEEKNLFE